MKCCFIVPYFGKLPKEFPIFLKTCGFNKGFDWIIYTDDHTYFDYPQNVIVKYMEFSDFRELAESKFDFSISMDSPYKLCDYKPAYGLICEEDIVEYDFWGHTDIDVVLGDLSSFMRFTTSAALRLKSVKEIIFSGFAIIFTSHLI